jgi:hypothetical protein
MLRVWEQVLRIFQLDTSKPFYWRAHVVLLLILCELMLLFFRTRGIEVYNGADFWFSLLYKLIPYGTLPFSLVLIIYFGWLVLKDVTSIGGGGFDDDMLKAGQLPMPFAPFRPDWAAFTRIILEGVFLGALLFKLLPQLTFFLADFLLDGDVFMPTSLDANPAMAAYHTNIFQSIAIALGAGVYEELLFRKWLFEWLLRQAPKYLKQAWLHQAAAAVACSLVYALSHYLYPYGDNFSLYSLMHRFFFSLLMCFIFLRRNLGTAAWTNAFYQVFYFVFR